MYSMAPRLHLCFALICLDTLEFLLLMTKKKNKENNMVLAVLTHVLDVMKHKVKEAI